MSKREDEQQRLVDLFHNRAELKKEFISLRQEREDLGQRLEEQERVGQRAHDDLKALEELLAAPKTAFNAIVFYHLRGLWRACNGQLASFADILRKQQQDRQRKKQIMNFNQDRERRLVEVNEEVVRVKAETDEFKAVIEALEMRLAEMSGFFSYFKRKSLKARIDQETKNLSICREEIEELFNKRIKIESEQWPDEAGLGTKGKRAINLALIAYAQHLYIHFSDHDLGLLSRIAINRRPAEIEYGNRADCEFLMERIRGAVDEAQTDRDYANEIKSRIDEIKSVAEYVDSDSVVPIAASIPTLGLTVGNMGFTRTVSELPTEINILAENFWDLESVLVH